MRVWCDHIELKYSDASDQDIVKVENIMIVEVIVSNIFSLYISDLHKLF
jgi:hypothetical protein